MNDYPQAPEWVRKAISEGLVIPAHPLALTSARRWDERRQRALTRYYHAAGAGGLAVGVHTTQFAIRRPEFNLFRPVLRLAAETLSACDSATGRQTVRIAGICGETPQACAEAELARELGYHAGLLSLAALPKADNDTLIQHCQAVAGTIPLVGFYLQPAAGGRLLSYEFWRRFAEIPNVAAIKMAPFNRYQTLDVVRAMAESGRDDIALYTGNDDHIVLDLLIPYRFRIGRMIVERRIVGGLLGQWAVWTKNAVSLHSQCRKLVKDHQPISFLQQYYSGELTDANAAIFDAANHFAGCIPGIHEVLRRQGLLEGVWCLDPNESLGPGQAEEIARVYAAYPHLNDDDFVRQHLGEWLK